MQNFIEIKDIETGDKVRLGRHVVTVTTIVDAPHPDGLPFWSRTIATNGSRLPMWHWDSREPVRYLEVVA